MEEIIEVVKDIREDVRDMLSFVDDMFPESAPLPERPTEFKMYPEERAHSAERG
jgi:hypothetical protein